MNGIIILYTLDDGLRIACTEERISKIERGHVLDVIHTKIKVHMSPESKSFTVIILQYGKNIPVEVFL